MSTRRREDEGSHRRVDESRRRDVGHCSLCWGKKQQAAFAFLSQDLLSTYSSPALEAAKVGSSRLQHLKSGNTFCFSYSFSYPWYLPRMRLFPLELPWCHVRS